jgi:hypothetical protein
MFRAALLSLPLLPLLLLMPGCTKPPAPATAALEPGPAYDSAFWAHWGDGRGELSAYDLVTPRYGAPRRGVAVAIFVTETFSNKDRVKADPGRHPKRDEFPVMKLNLVEDFATGIYDYHLLTSAFVSLTAVNSRGAGAPTKLSFSAQEWCGHTYAQVLFDHRYARYTGHSYFDGEADSSSAFIVPANAQAEDALMIWARGLAAPVVAAGDSAEAPVTGSLRIARLTHQPLAIAPARFRRASSTERVTVPAGTFEADVAGVTLADGRAWTFWVERAEPHRIVRWSCSDGEHAELLGSDRLAYWEMNAPGGEAALAKLGLTPRPLRTP